MIVGYVPTTVHAHHPTAAIPARATQVHAPDATVGDVLDPVDPVEGFLAALRRHLATSETDAEATGQDADAASVETVPPADTEPREPHEVPATPAEPKGPEVAVEPPPDSAEPARPAGPGSEHGDRGYFLAGARQWLAGGTLGHRALPPPPPPLDDEDDDAVPEAAYAHLDPDDLAGTFVRAIEQAGGVCHRVEGEVPDLLLDQLVAELDAWDAVVSAEPEAVALGERLAGRGVEVAPATPQAAANAALGVTSAIAGIAATGSVVLDSRRAGGRLASLLPAVHLCVLPVERLVATPGDLLRTLGGDPAALPSALVIETGPARAGDIGQLLTVGAHGATRLHVVLVGPGPAR